MNIRLDIEYDGTEYCGWQRQLDRPTIQAIIEDLLAEKLGRRAVLYGASRTDSGVHARGQVANFYTQTTDPHIPPDRWRIALNTRLPSQIRILRSSEMAPGFHAQRMAGHKSYEYRILHRAYASALDRRVFFYSKPLDWEAIRQAMPHFLGEHDFKAFQASGSTVLTTTRTVRRFELFEEKGGIFRFEIEATGFLKQMVRNIIGTLIEIGEGKRSADSIPDILLSRDRTEAGRTLPASGLCLAYIHYPQYARVSEDGREDLATLRRGAGSCRAKPLGAVKARPSGTLSNENRP